MLLKLLPFSKVAVLSPGSYAADEKDAGIVLWTVDKFCWAVSKRHMYPWEPVVHR